jgi:Protein of unknown function (DUF2846)
MRIHFALAALLVIPVSARSQQQPAPVEAKLAVDPSKNANDSTIVFFREGHFAGSALKPSIYLDGKELDRLANGRWFSVHAAPGKHELQSSAKNEPATAIETVAGQTTYVQMIVVVGTWRGAGRLLQVAPADAQKVVTKLKPLHE